MPQYESWILSWLVLASAMVPYIASITEISADFESAGIDISEPGFYDEAAFKNRELLNPYFIYNYARFVRGREYSQDYLDRAEKIILTVADVLGAELVKDGREGACVDLTMPFARILDREGVWNHFVNGSLVIDSPTERIAGMYSVDFGDQIAGHAWLFAPPFNVVDLYPEDRAPSVFA